MAKNFTQLPVRVAGSGHAVPRELVLSETLDSKYGFQPGYLSKVSGVVSRYVCSTESQIDMAVSASREALLQAELKPQDIDLVLGACAVPYQPIPATAPLVMQRLGLTGGTAAAFDVNATCLSFLTAFDLAAARIALGQNRRVLVFSSEVASRALPWKEQPDVAALFGDGAAAVVLEAPDSEGPTVRASLMKTFSSDYSACQIGSGGTRFDYQTEPKSFAENSTFHMDGQRLFRVAHRHFPTFIQDLLNMAGWSMADVDVVVPHQASPLGLTHLIKTTGLHPDRVIDISTTYGNQIAASIPTALDIGIKDGRITTGSKVLMLGTSAGVSFGGMALDF